MHWNSLSSVNEIHGIIESSKSTPQVIFKHSTSCSISGMAKMRVEDNISNLKSNAEFHYLDLLRNRDLSRQIAEMLEVHHESPQIIMLIGGEVVYDASHFDISIDELNESLDYHLAGK